ncbi:hypothetical protein E4P40_07775 [Blastococcus sp. CT_GayMR20]|uniref:hypothetical protein n=1 Tax=Blastococcus sp. CT_GayMR20 TaxID=2559609 RepID=UPI0010735474|nr:hypothetical protein [Blastococcus sp. CT_GayMR20]TFV90107.1 hypothetical protein E4P40_07775 [Blastococcus sp. CT_GayMR20]
MNSHSDAVDAVLAAFSDHLEHGASRPTLDHLDRRDRQLVEDLMRLMETGRWIDPSASAPSLEALLAGTEFAESLPPAPSTSKVPVLHRMQKLLADVDPRVEVNVHDDGFVSFGYLDLLARFHPLDTDDPWLAGDALRAMFDADSYVDLVALVATQTDELLARVVSRYDVDPTISTASNRPARPPRPVLPLALAARSILEVSAPEWGEFGLNGGALPVGDVAELGAQIATQVVAEEAKRRYQGDKALAYRGLVGHEQRLVKLISTATGRGSSIDLAAAIDRFARQVA